jgi:hypothetical protein
VQNVQTTISTFRAQDNDTTNRHLAGPVINVFPRNERSSPDSTNLREGLDTAVDLEAQRKGE